MRDTIQTQANSKTDSKWQEDWGKDWKKNIEWKPLSNAEQF